MNALHVITQLSRVIVAIGLMVVVTTGCLVAADSNDDFFLNEFKKAKKKDFKISPADLRSRLQGLSILCAGIIEKSGDDIIAQTTDPAVKKNALLWKMNAVPALFNAFYYPKPLIGMMDAWAFSLQMKQFFISDTGRDSFGEWHIIAWRAAAQVEAKLVRLAKLISREGDISLPVNFIESWSKSNPIQFPFSVRETIVPVVLSGAAEKEMSSFRAVSQLPYQLDDLANRFAAYGEHLPKQARWQTELLLSDLEAYERIEVLMSELETTAYTLKEVSALVDKMPDLINNETQTVLGAIRSERIETLSAIEKQRIETLEYFTLERVAVLEFLEKERAIILEVLQKERDIAINELEVRGNRIVQDAIKGFNKSIDHFFLRAAQLAITCLAILCIFGLVAILIVIKKPQVQ